MYDSTEICNVVMYCTQNAYCTWHERVTGKDRREKDGEREGVRDRGDREREWVGEERCTLACSLYILTIGPIRIHGVYKPP